MASKLIPRLQAGGSLTPQQLQTQYLSGLFNATKAKQSTVDLGDMLSTWKPDGGTMSAIKPISLGSSSANALTGLGSAPGTTQMGGLKPMPVSQAPGATPGMSAAAVGGIASGVAELGVAGIDAFSKVPVADEFGNAKQENKGATVAKSTLASAGKGAALGATIGSVVPVLGTGVGAAVGGVIGAGIGFFKGKKDAKQDSEQFDAAHKNSYGNFYGNQYANQFQAMKAKDGMKLKTANVMTRFTETNRLVPRYKHGGAMNVIAAGKLHKENNSLGRKDKGIPVINSKGEKEFELEKEELILNLEASKQVEKLVNNYNTNHDDIILEDIGKFVHKELLKNTQDNSKKFGLEV